ncbi:glycosyltransferase family 4 protein [Microbulbifer agarilyticus]
MRDEGKLAVLIPEFPGQTHIFFWREIQALRKANHTVQIVSTRKPKENNFHEFYNEVQDTFYLTQIDVLKLLGYCLLNPVWLARAIRYCFSLSGGFKNRLRALLFIPFAGNLNLHCKKHGIEHMHVHSSADAAHIVAIAALSQRFSYSVCIHGNLNQYGTNHREKLSGASAIITVTNPLRDEILTALPEYPVNQVHVLPMGVDVSKFLPRSYASNGAAPVIMTSVSRLAYVKGHTYTLQALAALPKEIDFVYQIVGDGEMRDKLEQEVEALGLTDKVVFLGFKKEADVYDLLQKTDIFLLTSFGYGEAAPVAIMEAMACGVAPICSIIGGTKDMISDKYDGMLVRQKDVDDIKQAILYLLEDQTRIKEIALQARRTAEQKFCHVASANTLAQHVMLG